MAGSKSKQQTGMNIFLSNHVDVLSGIVASLMANYPLQDCFAREKFLIVNLGMKTYLQQSLAENNNIMALCEFSEIWSFIFDIQHEVFPEAQYHNVLSREHITWNIFSLLRRHSLSEKDLKSAHKQKISEEEYSLLDTLRLGLPIKLDGPLRNYLQHDDTGDRAYELAAKIADALDLYQMYRPEWIIAWNAIPLSAFDDYEENPDNMQNPLRIFIENQCKNLAKTKSVAPDGQDEEQRAQSLKASVDLVRNLFENNIWQIKLWCLLKFNLNLIKWDRHLQENVPLQGEDLRWALENLDRASSVYHLIDYLEKTDPAQLQLKEERVFVFGISHFPQIVLDFFQALSRHMQVHVFCIDPCADYWGDLTKYSANHGYDQFTKKMQASVRTEAELKKLKQSLKKKRSFAKFIMSQDSEENYDANGNRVVGHPLLLSLGKQGRDMFTMMCDMRGYTAPFLPFFVDNESDYTSEDVVVDGIEYQKLTGRTLLHCLQDQMVHLKEQRILYTISPEDSSLSIHVCHTKKREVEVLHDNLLQLFNQAYLRGEKVYPKDILVMVPCINEYAPYITAVFGGTYAKGDPDYIPFVISDRSEAEANTTAQAVLRLLQISSNRVTATTVIDILSEETVSRRFGLTATNVETISEWIRNNSIFWGLDHDDIADVTEIPLPGTFEQGLDRMLAGSLLGENSEIPCFTDIEGSDALILGKFWDFIHALRELKIFFHPHLALEPAMWLKELQTRLFDRFFDQSEETVKLLQPVLQVVEELRDVVQTIRQSPIITLPVFTAALRSGLDRKMTYKPFFREKVNFCSLVPMRAVPFKHIFILGLNDLDFPRNDHSPSFNLVGNRELSQRGDRSHNLDDRYLFLEALLSAQESIYLSYIGQSPVDKQELNPSIVLNELVYYLCDICTVPGVEEPDRIQAVKKRLIRYEHLNAWHIDNFQQCDASSGALAHSPSYSRACINYELDIHNEKPMVGQGVLMQDFSSLQHKLVDLPDLIAFMKNPTRFFLRKVLRLHLNLQDNSVLQEDENFVLEPLQSNKLLQEMLTFTSDQWDNFLERKSALGVLPYGIFKEKVCADLKQQASDIANSLQAAGISSLADLQYEVCPKKELKFSLPRGALDRSYRADPQLLLDPNFDVNGDRLNFVFSLRAERCTYPVVFSAFKAFEVKGKSQDLRNTALNNAELLFSAVGQAIAWYLYDGSLRDITMIDRKGVCSYLTAYKEREMEELLRYMAVFYLQGCCAPFPMSSLMLKKIDEEQIEPEDQDTVAGPAHLVLKSNMTADFQYNIEAQCLFNDIEQLLANESLAAQAQHYFNFYCQYIGSHLVLAETK